MLWPAPLRDASGRGIYGKKDLTPEQNKQVAGHSLIAIRVAWLALAMAEKGYTFVIEQPDMGAGCLHMFNLLEYQKLRVVPGVRVKRFVQCPFKAISIKHTAVIHFLVRLLPRLFMGACPHGYKWW